MIMPSRRYFLDFLNSPDIDNAVRTAFAVSILMTTVVIVYIYFKFLRK